MATTITFASNRPFSLFDRDSIGFEAIVDGSRIRCVASAEALMARFGCGYLEGDLLQCGLQQMSILQGVARHLIESGLAQDGEVLLTTKTWPASW